MERERSPMLIALLDSDAGNLNTTMAARAIRSDLQVIALGQGEDLERLEEVCAS